MIWTCTLTTMVQVSVDTILSLKVLAFARASGAGVIKKVKCYKKLNVETIYNAGNAGTIADINSGALYVFWIGTQAGAASDANFIGSIRGRFIDP